MRKMIFLLIFLFSHVLAAGDLFDLVLKDQYEELVKAEKEGVDVNIKITRDGPLSCIYLHSIMM